MQSQAKNSLPNTVTPFQRRFPEFTNWQRLEREAMAFQATNGDTGEPVRVAFIATSERINAQQVLAVQRRIEKSVGEPLGVEKIIDAVDLEDGSTAIVTRFMEGETLEGEVERGAIHWDDATWMTAELAKIIANLHKSQITYGALHPSNVFLVSGAIPILRSLERAILGRTDEIVVEDAAANPFMPPELQRSAITPRVDVYGLGAALRSMLAGDISAFHANDSTALPPHYDHTPDEILAVINKATAANPADRYADAMEFQRALEPAIATALERERARAAISFPGLAAPVSDALTGAPGVSPPGAIAAGAAVVGGRARGPAEAVPSGMIDLRPGAQESQVERRQPRSRGVFDRSEPVETAIVPIVFPLAVQRAVASPSEPAPLAGMAPATELAPPGSYLDALRERSGLILVTAALVLIGLISFSVAALSGGAPNEIASAVDDDGLESLASSGSGASVPDAAESDGSSAKAAMPDEVGNGFGPPDIVLGAGVAVDLNEFQPVKAGETTTPTSSLPAVAPSAPIRTVPPRTTPTAAPASDAPTGAPAARPPTAPPAPNPGTGRLPTTQVPLYDPPGVQSPSTGVPQFDPPAVKPPTSRPSPTNGPPTTQVPATQVPTAPVTQSPTSQAPVIQTPDTAVPASGPATVLAAVANPDFESVRINFRTSDCASVSYSISGGGALSSNYGDACVTDHSVRLGGVPYNGTQLRPSTAYTVSIKTTSRSGQVSTRNVSFTTKAQPVAPLAISNLRVSEITASTARVSFTANKCVGSSFVVTGGGSGRYDWGYPNTDHCLTDQWGTIGYFQSSRLLAGAENTVTVTARTKDGESVTRSITFSVPAG